MDTQIVVRMREEENRFERFKLWIFIGLPMSILLILCAIFGYRGCVHARYTHLPVDAFALHRGKLLSPFQVRNLLAPESLQQALGDGRHGLTLDLSGLDRLLDGSRIKAKNIYGTVYAGPYPFKANETGYTYARMRTSAPIRKGRADIDLASLLKSKVNSENWFNEGQVMLRVELYEKRKQEDRALGIYDLPAAFFKTEKAFTYQPWLREGPFVNLLNSDNPRRVVISFKTPRLIQATVLLSNGDIYSGKPSQRHEITLTDLEPDTEYHYRIKVGDVISKPYRLRTAPLPGQGPVCFAYCGDSREGVGGGRTAYMGINYTTMERHAARAYLQDCRFFLMGGDLINGYTSSREDFSAQLHAWKQAMSGFWHERPVYPAMGNHEALIHMFAMKSKRMVGVDAWPYATNSAEAVFAEAFSNPRNAPAAADDRRPFYQENVYSFQYGFVQLIAFNNNYWYSSDPAVYGGCPEGYIMEDQLNWIEHELRRAQTNDLVKYIFLFAQEPVFPCGGHIKDAMWYHGSNLVRAYTYEDNMLRPEDNGILDVRNRLVMAVSHTPKVVAVLCSDEHAYHRVLIDHDVPIGEPLRDDIDLDGVIDWPKSEKASPLPDLLHPIWYITCGGGGAPYYAEEPTPWNQYWKSGRVDGVDGYYYSSQESLLIFQADEHSVGLTVYNPYGEIIDEVKNLMSRRNGQDPPIAL